jgi:hypothetical protein
MGADVDLSSGGSEVALVARSGSWTDKRLKVIQRAYLLNI